MVTIFASISQLDAPVSLPPCDQAGGPPRIAHAPLEQSPPQTPRPPPKRPPSGRRRHNARASIATAVNACSPRREVGSSPRIAVGSSRPPRPYSCGEIEVRASLRPPEGDGCDEEIDEPLVIEFPSQRSVPGSARAPNTKPLSACKAWDYSHHEAGDCISETVEVDLDLATLAISHSRWIFDISDLTAEGVENSFEVLLDGEVVGSFSFSGNSSYQRHHFDLTLEHHKLGVHNNSIELGFRAKSSVPAGMSSWDWLSGGRFVGLASHSTVME